MKRAIGIPLLTGQIALIDEQDAHLCRLRWKVWTKPDGGMYVKRCDRRHIPQFSDMPALLHRAVMAAGPGQIIDHINGDTLDNRRANLRFATAEQNCRNFGPARRNNTSGTIGVGWHKGRGKWQASIKLWGKLVYLGIFDDFEEAVDARRRAEVMFWGVEPRRAPELLAN